MAFLKAFGSYVPARVVSNAELAERLECAPDWILNVSGIAERRYAEASETVIDLAERAARDCMKPGFDTSKIGMIMVSSGSSQRRFPGPAAEIAFRLGLAGIPAIDVPMASAGSLFALAMAAQFAAGAGGAVLVIAAEKMSAVVERGPLDRNTAILFGDGAGACLVDPHEGLASIVDSRLHSDGSFADNLRLEFDQPIHMNGMVVIAQASRKVPAVIRELLDRHSIPPSSVETFLMHQANQNLIVRIAKSLEVAPETFFSNIARYGNTSSASMLIAATEWNSRVGFKSGQPVVFAGFGAGFHWGALLAVGS